jgi:hypothetical protein
MKKNNKSEVNPLMFRNERNTLKKYSIMNAFLIVLIEILQRKIHCASWFVNILKENRSRKRRFLPLQRDQIQENVYFLHTKHIENINNDGQKAWFGEKRFIANQQSTGQIES